MYSSDVPLFGLFRNRDLYYLRIAHVQRVAVSAIRDPITYDPRPSGWWIFLELSGFFGGMTTLDSLGLPFFLASMTCNICI